MTLKYRSITANCGNDSLGPKATLKITEQLTEGTESLDFCVINCQEVNVNKTRQELQLAVGEQFTVTCVGRMVSGQ
jgi:hypothetical protein